MADYKMKTIDCSVVEFEINGVQAYEGDFVIGFDRAPWMADEPGSCGDMQADIKPASAKVLEKYKIDEEEYMEIAGEVAGRISLGYCEMCV